MPMDIEGALWAYAHKDEYPEMGRRAEAAIREAFEVRDRARAELERLEAEHPVPLQQLANPAHALIVTLRRILGEEGST